MGLLDYCWERSLKPNRTTNQSSSSRPPQLSEYKRGGFMFFPPQSCRKSFHVDSSMALTSALIFSRQTDKQTDSKTEREHDWKDCKNNWQIRFQNFRGNTAQIHFSFFILRYSYSLIWELISHPVEQLTNYLLLEVSIAWTQHVWCWRLLFFSQILCI